MATNILLNKAYNGQEIAYSATVSTVSNIDISAIITTGSTGQIRYTIERKTANSAWRTAKDDKGAPLEFSTIGAVSDGINLVALNAYAIRIKVEILSGAGTINLEYEII